MPAFDPVRDAVLNSPVTSTNPLPPQPPSSATSSPSLGRRATDLSVLLNSESQEPTVTLRTPPLPRPSSGLSHLLNADPAHAVDFEDKLSAFQPLSRSTNLSVATATSSRNPHSSSSTFSRRGSDPLAAAHPALSSPSSATSTGTSSARNLFGDSPIRESPVSPSFPAQTQTPSASLPQWSSNPPTNMPPPPQPKRSNVPYNPRNRITPPGSVLVPLSQSELEMFAEFRGVGTSRLTKRKRGHSPEGEGEPPAKKLGGDVGVVVEHYNARPEVGVVQRQESPIIGLKNFNNWVKSVLITRFAHPALAAGAGSASSNGHARGRSSGRTSSGKVLDMGCGKGGDMTKWAKARVKELIGVDIAAVSVDQARSRWESLRAPKFAATFAAVDCYTTSLSKVIPPARLAEPFDVVSMQFCMHYAFENVQKARCMLENVSRWLRPGGVFIGTIPNAELLLSQLDAIPPSQEDLSFGNSVYKISFESRDRRPIFGHKYWFFLKDAVENVPEYVVHWDNFVQMAAEYHLNLLYMKEFHQVFEEHQEHPEFKPLMLRMKVVDDNGESAMDEDQWEAANIYIAFAFEKQR
ncbi:mRNA cap guanine-N7 methyltransferase [Pleurotus ostreatus]|uniref:mRNA cap guanine-N(7) methyltransferase n=2 Tax=Pleurotus ostreatus TaxID=5322 RepID=A0A8H7A696_PLEOS|nr:mRNA cap guanine-N7 methyltransferase [Pleurotus ostreatus]KAF7440741.1 mRNA cap guanine-N7 methyltransferase [Pleurotus ostreatus]